MIRKGILTDERPVIVTVRADRASLLVLQIVCVRRHRLAGSGTGGDPLTVLDATTGSSSNTRSHEAAVGRSPFGTRNTRSEPLFEVLSRSWTLHGGGHSGILNREIDVKNRR